MSSEDRYALDRSLLGDQGAALDEDTYARAVASMGVEAPEAPISEWSLRHFRKLQHEANDDENVARGSSARWRLLFDSPPRVVLPGARLWAGAPSPIDLVRILSHPAVRAGSVWLDWPNPQADPRWQWPLRIGAFADDFEALDLAELAALEPASSLTRAELVSRDSSATEVLVMHASAREALARILALRHRVRAGFVLLVAPLDTQWPELRVHVEGILVETQAVGVALVQPHTTERLVERINDWVAALASGVPLDVASFDAFRRPLLLLDRRALELTELQRSARAVARRLDRLEEMPLPEVGPEANGGSVSHLARTLKRRIDDEALSGAEPPDAASLVELSDATCDVERVAAEREAPRYLQGDLYRFDPDGLVLERRGLVLGIRHVLDVTIGEPGLGSLAADVPIDEDAIDWADQDSVTLQVMFTEIDQWPEPLRGTLELYRDRKRRSPRHRFEFTPSKPGPFQGRVSVYYRGRILQTMLLVGRVVESVAALEGDDSEISVAVEAVVRRSLVTLKERRRFDACVVCNHGAERRPAITAAGKDGAYIASLTPLQNALAQISDLLTGVANDVERYKGKLLSDDKAELLCALASEGNTLYRKIVLDYINCSSSAPRELQKSDYLQIVTAEPDAIVPLEFVYEYPLPKDGAEICKNAPRALRSGKCPKSCRPTTSPAPHVCPMGFWGLQKVIERHLHVPELAKPAKLLAEPIAGREQLSLAGATLVATSEQVGESRGRSLVGRLRKVRKGKVSSVKTWDKWTKAISKDRPALLVVLPHADGEDSDITLEIGGDVLASKYINHSYVHCEEAPPPLTILFGCDTANAADTQAYLRHVEVFRQADSALVLGTIATVFGPDAAELSKQLIAHLQETIEQSPGRFGEVLRDVKRKAVADGSMIALCLVAFGDADWQVVAGRST